MHADPEEEDLNGMRFGLTADALCCAFGSSAVMESFVASGGGNPCGVAEGGEDPWLCGPGFRRVCLCRGMV